MGRFLISIKGGGWQLFQNALKKEKKQKEENEGGHGSSKLDFGEMI
jgi:hypothetical protein